MDSEQSYITGSQMAAYGPPEDRRMQNGVLGGQEMTGSQNRGDNGIKYHRKPELSPSLNIRRPYHRVPDFSNNSHGGIRYGERAESVEYRSTDYDLDGFGIGDNNQYGNPTGMATTNINDRVDAHENAKYIAVNQYRRGKPQSYNSHASLDFEEDDDTENSYENSEVEDEESLFVPENDQIQKMHQSPNDTSPEAGRPIRSDEINMQIVANPRIPPRSARIQKRPNVNLVPPTVPTSSISDAALLKRGLKRSKNSVMSKKSHGPNDPENILIVNLRENEDKSWPEISLILNERRIRQGKSPSFTPNGCHNRYNRNAPILFAAEGKEFIPVSMQRKLKKNPAGPVVWNDETDTILIKAVKTVESRKWDEVAQLFNTQGPYKITATEAAMRTKVI